MDESMEGRINRTLYTTVERARFAGRLRSSPPDYGRRADYGRRGSGDLPGGAEMLDERETVSPATPGRPEERATPVVLSGGALWIGIDAGAPRGVSPASRKARSSSLGPQATSSVASAQAVAAVERYLFI
jgi:hypothetical protein